MKSAKRLAFTIITAMVAAADLAFLVFAAYQIGALVAAKTFAYGFFKWISLSALALNAAYLLGMGAYLIFRKKRPYL